MSETKEYRVIELNLTTSDQSGTECLIAKLAERHWQGLANSDLELGLFSPDEAEYFIMDATSPKAQVMMRSPEEPVMLNLSEFVKVPTWISRHEHVMAYQHFSILQSSPPQ